MSKIRIHALAKELGVDSKRMLEILAGMGVEAKSASSTVEEDVAELGLRMRLRKRHEAFESELNMLCEGVTSEINELKSGCIQDYLNKLEYWINKHK